MRSCASPSGPHPVLYINRDRDVSRRSTLEENLARAGLEGARIKAVEGRDLPKEIEHLLPPSRLKPGEVGCYGSHLMAWRHILRHDLPHALVLEDDAALPTEMAAILDEVLGRAPEGWDFIHMCTARRRSFRPLIELSGGRKLVRFSRVPAVTRGYLVSKAGAEKLLKPIPRVYPVDMDMRRPWLFDVDAYGVVFPPIHETHATSTISAVPGAGRSRLRRGVQLTNPLHTVRGMIFNIRKLGPVWWLRCLGENGMARGASIFRDMRRAPRRRETAAIET